MKPIVLVHSEDPFRVKVIKKGARAISMASALSALKKVYPQIPSEEWVEIHSSEHHAIVLERKEAK